MRELKEQGRTTIRVWDGDGVVPMEPEVAGVLCGCGCGQRAPIAKWTSRRDGHVRGQSERFIWGHSASVQSHQDSTERFWSKVDRTTTPDGCWPFTGYRDKAGYGHIWFNNRMRPAHQVVLELVGFVRPFAGLQTRHVVCDNPPCCRPSHLRIGTAQDDVDDKVSKGRQSRVQGERRGMAKLQQQDVDEIHHLYAAGGISQRALARQFGVNQKTIWAIIRGETWAP